MRAPPQVSESDNRPPINRSIQLLSRRISELEHIPWDDLTDDDGDAEIDAIRDTLSDTIALVFGRKSDQYNRIISPDFHQRDFLQYGSQTFRQRLGRIKFFFGALLLRLRAALEILAERREEAPSQSERTLEAYRSLSLHAEIERAASKLFTDGHYSNAVEAAVKGLNGLVRLRSGLEVDGDGLMTAAFSPKNPILRFSKLADRSDADEQRGFMMMFQGAVAGLRNPRAHSFIQDSPERALEFIAFVSLLAKLLDQAEKVCSDHT